MKRFFFPLILIMTLAAGAQVRPYKVIDLPEFADSVVVSPMTNTVYILLSDKRLLVMDGNTHQITRTMQVRTPHFFNRLSLDPTDPAGDVLFVATNTLFPDSAGEVWRIEPATGTMTLVRSDDGNIRSVVPGEIGPWFVVRHFKNDDSVDTLQAGFRLDLDEESWAMTLNQQNQVLYAGEEDGIRVYNTSVHQHAHRDTGGGEVDFLGVNPVTGRVFVASNDPDFSNNNGKFRISIFGGVETNNALLREHFHKTNEGDLVVNSTTNQVFTSGLTGQLKVIDGNSLDMRDVEPFGVLGWIRGLMVNQTTGLLYGDQGGLVEIDPTESRPPFLAGNVSGSRPAAINTITNRIYYTAEKQLIVFDGTTAIEAASDPKERFHDPQAAGIVAMSMDVAHNETFFANSISGNVTAIFGNGGNANVSYWNYPASGAPIGIVSNPVNRKTYVLNAGAFGAEGTVDIIQRPTGWTPNTLKVGNDPTAIAFNPTTGRAYVTNTGGTGQLAEPPSVTVIDENDHTTNVRTGGELPVAIAVNHVTNTIYVANFASNDVSIIDGYTNTLRARVKVPAEPLFIAVNHRTNDAFVACSKANQVAVLHADDSVTLVPAGNRPSKIGVNEAMNRVFVLNEDSENITVLDGTTLGQAMPVIYLQATPGSMSVDEGSNRILVTASVSGADWLLAVDATTGSISRYSYKEWPSLRLVGINPVTETAYVANAAKDEILIVELSDKSVPQPYVKAEPFTNDRTADPTPSIPVSIDNSKRGLNVRHVYFQLGSFSGPWQKVAVREDRATVDLPQLPNGPHTVYFMAADDESRQPRSHWEAGDPIRTGTVSAYSFEVACQGLTLSSGSSSVPAKASTGSFFVNTQCSWSAQPSASWIKLGAYTGAGSGTLTFTTLANPGAQRTGTITVNGQTHTITQAASSSPNSDFNGDGRADILWRHYATGSNSMWLMSGKNKIGNLSLPPEPDVNVSIEGTGDLNGDGRPDIVLRNYVTGDNSVWFMDGGTRTGIGLLTQVTDLKWTLEAVADFDKDGDADFAWRHYGTGQNAIWYMDGANIASTMLITGITDLNWKLEGAGDFNGDGNFDLVFRNAVSAENVVRFGPTFTNLQSFVAMPDPRWNLEAIGDFNGDGAADLVWRDYGSGENAVTYLNVNLNVTGMDALDPLQDTRYHLGGQGPGTR